MPPAADAARPPVAMRRPWLVALALLGLLGASPAPARAEAIYEIDHRVGDIAFAVHHLGLFSSHGDFGRFSGTLTLDEAHPERTRVDVTIDVGSVEMSSADAMEMLRSPDFFDVAQFPRAHFASTNVQGDGPSAYVVQGMLQMRGVTRPVTLRAELTARRKGPQAGQEVADFDVSGTLSRAAFGMTSEPMFISDRVELKIHARVLLIETPGAG
jgi:polyisoprenoid-binding protein YceI